MWYRQGRIDMDLDSSRFGMKARILKTNSKSGTYVMTITINPIEADRILEDMDTESTSSPASRSAFRWIAAIADEDQSLIGRINAGEDVSEWPQDRVS
jgi:hypothetical protein